MSDDRAIHGGTDDTSSDTERALRKRIAKLEAERDEWEEMFGKAAHEINEAVGLDDSHGYDEGVAKAKTLRTQLDAAEKVVEAVRNTARISHRELAALKAYDEATKAGRKSNG